VKKKPFLIEQIATLQERDGRQWNGLEN